jgi:psp operon transcriptional activator
LGSQELTREAEQVLLEYEWPGNVRELRNITERLALRDSNQPITAADLALDRRSARVGGR